MVIRDNDTDAAATTPLCGFCCCCYVIWLFSLGFPVEVVSIRRSCEEMENLSQSIMYAGKKQNSCNSMLTFSFIIFSNCLHGHFFIKTKSAAIFYFFVKTALMYQQTSY